MAPAVLLVDDDPHLLSSFRRGLDPTLDLTTATSAAEALQRLESRPYSVVVTDMRMPEMDGLQFIERARRIAPEAAYLMLTGNQDQQTAVDATNRGRVFRFLNKPCGLDDFQKATDAAHRHYELGQAEKELLNKTCAGAVGLLMDVLEANQPSIGPRLARLQETAAALRESVDLPQGWEIAVGSRLALVGFTCMDDSAAETFFATPPTDPEWSAVLRRATELSARLVSRVPRFQAVGQMIRLLPETRGAFVEGSAASGGSLAARGATLLHVALLWDALEWQGVRTVQAVAEIRSRLPELQPAYFDALEKLPAREAPVEPRTVEATDLEPGMVLYRDVFGPDGALLLRSGSRLTGALVEKLRDLGLSVRLHRASLRGRCETA